MDHPEVKINLYVKSSRYNKSHLLVNIPISYSLFFSKVLILVPKFSFLLKPLIFWHVFLGSSSFIICTFILKSTILEYLANLRLGKGTIYPCIYRSEKQCISYECVYTLLKIHSNSFIQNFLWVRDGEYHNAEKSKNSGLHRAHSLVWNSNKGTGMTTQYNKF